MLGCLAWIVLVPVALLLLLVPKVGPVLSIAVVAFGIWFTNLLWQAERAAEGTPARSALSGAGDDEDGDDSRPAVRASSGVTVKTTNLTAQDAVDLRELESVRTRVVGTCYYLSDRERDRAGGTSYLLILEPENEFDPLAIAVYSGRRKVGHVGAKRAAMMQPLLARIGAKAYIVGGTAADQSTIQLFVDLPRVPVLRKLAEHPAPLAES